MSNALQIFEHTMQPLVPRFGQVLRHIMPVDRFMRTLYTACERDEKLLNADRQSLLNAAMTGAVLGLEADGATGQFFLLPFHMKKLQKTVVQPCIGYKGYNTLAARAHITIAGGTVREGDEFDFEKGTKPFVRHKPKLGNEGRIIAAWSTATALDRPPNIEVLSLQDLLAVKAKSPRGSEPPWNDGGIGFQAMCEKTAKRRLARSMPLTLFTAAARMEEAHEEQGELSFIHPEKGVMTGTGEVITPAFNDVTPTRDQLLNPPSLRESAMIAANGGVEAFRRYCLGLGRSDYAELKAMQENERPYLDLLKDVAEAADRIKQEEGWTDADSGE